MSTLKYAYRYSESVVSYYISSSSLCEVICLFGVLRPTPYGDVAFTDERMQILTYTRHSWPLSIEGSLAFSMH